MIRFSTLLIFSSFFISCDKNHSHNQLEIEKIGSVQFSLPSDISPKSPTMKIDRFQRDLMYYLSEYSNDILVFDLDGESYVDKVSFPSSGPNGVGKIKGFSQVDRDILFISSKGHPTIFVSDFEGRVIDKIVYGEYNSSYKVYPSYFESREMRDPILVEDRIIIDNFLWGEKSDAKSRLNEHSIFVLLDTVLNRVEETGIQMPDDYFDTERYLYPRFAYVTDQNTRNTFVSLVNHDGMYKIDWDTGDHIYKVVPSLKSKDRNANKTVYSNPVEETLALKRNANLLIDPFRKLLYRVIKHEQSETIDGNNTIVPDDLYYLNDFSIVVLDYDLNVIGERVIDSERDYVMLNMFVGPKGLYISRNNVYSSSYQEEFLTFDIFKFLIY